MTAGKPRIILLNKCDMADPNATRAWRRWFQEQGQYSLAVDCKSGKGLNQFEPVVREALKERIAVNEEKGMSGKALRLMVVGIPNTGKSSFINKMCGRNRLKVANRPGVTRDNQWVVCKNSNIEMLDTPGVLWPKFEDPAVGDRLAFIGSIKATVTDPETIAVRLLEVLRTDYSDRLTERYRLKPGTVNRSHLSCWRPSAAGAACSSAAAKWTPNGQPICCSTSTAAESSEKLRSSGRRAGCEYGEKTAENSSILRTGAKCPRCRSLHHLRH